MIAMLAWLAAALVAVDVGLLCKIVVNGRRIRRAQAELAELERQRATTIDLRPADVVRALPPALHHRGHILVRLVVVPRPRQRDS